MQSQERWCKKKKEKKDPPQPSQRRFYLGGKGTFHFISNLALSEQHGTYTCLVGTSTRSKYGLQFYILATIAGIQEN